MLIVLSSFRTKTRVSVEHAISLGVNAWPVQPHLLSARCQHLHASCVCPWSWLRAFQLQLYSLLQTAELNIAGGGRPGSLHESSCLPIVASISAFSLSPPSVPCPLRHLYSSATIKKTPAQLGNCMSATICTTVKLIGHWYPTPGSQHAGRTRTQRPDLNLQAERGTPKATFSKVQTQSRRTFQHIKSREPGSTTHKWLRKLRRRTNNRIPNARELPGGW